MQSIFSTYSDIIERRELGFFSDISNQALVYKELETLNTKILKNLKSEKENITMIRERKEYVKAKICDLEYLTAKLNQVDPVIRNSIAKSLKALSLTISLQV